MTDEANARTIHQVAASVLRHHDRENRPLAARLQNAISRALMLSTISRANSEAGYTTSGATEGKLPPGVTITEAGELRARSGEFNLAAYLEPIRHQIERLERAVDDEQGLGEGRHHATKTGEELDAEILEGWVGVPSYVVATKAPHLGSPKTIENVRARAGLRRLDGTEKPLRAA